MYSFKTQFLFSSLKLKCKFYSVFKRHVMKKAYTGVEVRLQLF
jgi:hypothetical protein